MRSTDRSASVGCQTWVYDPARGAMELDDKLIDLERAAWPSSERTD